MPYIAGDPLLSVSRQSTDGAATVGQVSIPIPGGFVPTMCDVFVGGACLSPGDFDDSDGMQIKLTKPMQSGTQFRVVVWSPGQTVVNATGQLAGFRNRFINGAIRVTQRLAANAPVNVGWFYGLPDRWCMYAGAPAAALSLSTTSGAFGGITNRSWAYVTVATPPSDLTGSNMLVPFCQIDEGTNVYDLASGPMALSFIFNALVSGQYSISLIVQDNQPAVLGSYVTTFQYTSGTPAVVRLVVPQMPSGYALAGGTGPAVRVAVGAINTGTFQCPAVSLNSWVNGTGNYSAPGNVNWAAAASNWLMLTDAQLEPGGVVTPFERRPYGLELLLCQRYYWQSDVVTNAPVGTGQANTTANAYVPVSFPVRMRIAPQMGNPASMYRIGGEVVGAPTFDAVTPSGCLFHVAWSTTAFVAGNAVVLLAGTNPTVPCLTASAEL